MRGSTLLIAFFASLLPLPATSEDSGMQVGTERVVTSLTHVQVSHLRPGAVSPPPPIANPLANDPQAASRGLKDFLTFNCVGCHAPNGGGGMGPSLSDDRWIYGDEPAQIFLSIYQGRPNGMPAWGDALPQTTIWELVAYIKGISEPRTTFGRTVSRTPTSPDKQQTPAEYLSTVQPWSFTEAFSNGQKPNGE